MNSSSTKHSTAFIFLISAAIAGLFIIFYFDGTGLEADSFHHYLISRFAPEHPKLYLDHWGKPIYTLLSSPFAQLGLIGSKVFNLLLWLLSLYLGYKVLLEFKIKNAAYFILLSILIPLSFQTVYSAFTEPLFACSLVLLVFLFLKDRPTTATLIASFLPLMRSEGLIILGVIALYLLFKKHYKLLPFLLFGQLLYGLIGWLFFDKSILWTLGEIPYANLDSPYGSGDLFHFSEQMFYLCGLPLLILFLIGLIRTIGEWKRLSMEWKILVLGSFLAFFIFHTLAWYFGLFNSMGLKRVFGAVLPLMGIFMIYGLNGLTFFLKERTANLIAASICLIAMVYLFSGNKGAVEWKEEMNLSPAQQLADQCGNYILEKEIPFQRLIYADRFLQHSLEIDPFDQQQFQLLNQQSLKNLRPGDLLIWDNWHAPTDLGIHLEQLERMDSLSLLKAFETKVRNRESRYLIFRYRER